PVARHGRRSAHRAAGALVERSAIATLQLQPVAARQRHRQRQRPAALRTLHGCAGGSAVSLARTRKTPLVAVGQRSFDLLSLSVAFVLAVNAAHLPWWLSLALAFTLGWRWWQRRQRAGRV